MYNAFFGFREPPFSIAPDPRYLYLSERHKEALAHLMYGVQGQGGFIVITGEVGTGKTTVCRCFLDSIPEHVDVALILNPRLSARELLSAICDELGVRHPAGASIKRLIDQLNHHLLEAHAQGRHTVLIIDEAQNLSADVLEQLRLLTNLETREKKLLQIVLLGQPELQDMLAMSELRQLSQRVTARYHLGTLSREELDAYVSYRLSVAGQKQQLFDRGALNALFRLSHGIPRLINLIADRALLGAYSQGTFTVDKQMVKQAAKEVLGGRISIGHEQPEKTPEWLLSLAGGAIGGLLLAGILFGAWAVFSEPDPIPELAGSADSANASAAAGAGNAVPESPSVASGTGVTEPEQQPRPVLRSTTKPQGSQQTDSDLLGRFSPNEDNDYQAYQALFRTWGIDYREQGNRYFCEHAETRGLRCLHKQGNWRSLLQVNRPAVLKLFNEEGEEYFITLTRVSDGIATFELAGRLYRRSVNTIDAHWLGDYSVFWRVPAYDSALINPGDVTDKELWLQQALIQLRKRYEIDGWEASRLSNRPLEEQIKWYQRQVGLVPDGIPGTMTLIRMNSDLEPDIPRLNPGRHASFVVSQN